MKLTKLMIVMGLVLALSGCDSDPWCWLADDTIGCLIITDKQGAEIDSNG